MQKSILFCVLMVFSLKVSSQHFSEADTLRGSITEWRSWWDLTYYHLDLNIMPSDSTIKGSNLIQYTVLKPHNVIQVDLQAPLRITKITQDGINLSYRTKGSAYFINLKKDQKTGSSERIVVHYEGRPLIARRAPWEGGFSWSKDQAGNPFAATSCQGIGASIWWPCKDHMSDEVDSMTMSITVPNPLTDVSNGRLRKIIQNDNNTTTFEWFVSNPINNYGVNVNIADYVHYRDTFSGENGILDIDYYVLKENYEKAQTQFLDVKKMLEAFEHWFGPYPFYEDGYKLVEAPYLGMEHQSSITYGNQYKKGYLGRDLSGTGWGLKFDFIIIHESGHEWFANNITYKDVADMWIHESFTNYSESLFLDYHYGKKAGAEYVIGTRKGISNDRPIIGTYGVNSRGSGDMYPKGGNLLHGLRQLTGDDVLWRKVLRGLNKKFYHQTVTTNQIETYMEEVLNPSYNIKAYFDQYLRDHRIPVLEYRIKKRKFEYRWTNAVAGFDINIPVTTEQGEMMLAPTTEWKKMKLDKDKLFETVTPDIDYYVYSNKVEK